mmetsp:Transcript_16651/g.21662  ORF Transcript_16651/g.21662 Transcript_16651/m.21662 type:complete len:788 (+) Transcript_16651:139-2502(+)|eukprot:CAMPEP_0197292618 /NCGR_PEP_ID=MMETSP0890-20130614/24280_1 /TAXON_ID=44058 ORGANISM="Aureoumbra lagunensis, Strain CCMP1510" /NCGR_SAMPLE_ID=MMETSP0890 /ASSEMBLY_ACC=CAM_ASM_000533 /LENGTH=787 /DNA_ID=CAMNT_0042766673 /DNA_START=59 /DNA_END=2422 /DNA_ORIENTATION=-
MIGRHDYDYGGVSQNDVEIGLKRHSRNSDELDDEKKRVILITSKSDANETQGAENPSESQGTNLLPVRLVISTVLIASCELLAFNLILPFVGDMVLHLGIEPQHEGEASALLTGAYGLGLTLSSEMWGRLSDKWDRKKALFLSCVCSALSIFFLGATTNFWVAIAIRFIGGICNGLLPILKAMLNERTTAENRTRCFSLLQISSSVGGVLGPTIGGALVGGLFPDTRPFFLPCTVCAILQFFLALVGVLLIPQRSPDYIVAHDMHLLEAHFDLQVPPTLVQLSGEDTVKHDESAAISLLSNQGEGKKAAVVENNIQKVQTREEISKEEEENSRQQLLAPVHHSYPPILSQENLLHDTTMEIKNLQDVCFFPFPNNNDTNVTNTGEEKIITKQNLEKAKAKVSESNREIGRKAFYVAAILCALASFLDALATISQALLMTAPRSNSGAEFTDEASGLIFGASGLLFLFYMIFTFPHLEAKYHLITLFYRSMLFIAICAIILPLLVVKPSRSNSWVVSQGPPTTTSTNIDHSLPQSENSSLLFIIFISIMNSASATALIAGNVLIQEAIDHGRLPCGASNGFAQALDSFARLVAPFFSGFLFDLGNSFITKTNKSYGAVCPFYLATFMAFFLHLAGRVYTNLFIKTVDSNAPPPQELDFMSELGCLPLNNEPLPFPSDIEFHTLEQKEDEIIPAISSQQSPNNLHSSTTIPHTDINDQQIPSDAISNTHHARFLLPENQYLPTAVEREARASGIILRTMSDHELAPVDHTPLDHQLNLLQNHDDEKKEA